MTRKNSGNPPKLTHNGQILKTQRVNSSPHHHHPHLQFESRLSTGRGRLFFGQMACCSPPPSFSSPHRQQKGSQQPIRCAGGGLLPVISDEVRYAKGIYYANPSRGSFQQKGNRVRNEQDNNCDASLSRVFSANIWIINSLFASSRWPSVCTLL